MYVCIDIYVFTANAQQITRMETTEFLSNIIDRYSLSDYAYKSSRYYKEFTFYFLNVLIYLHYCFLYWFNYSR